jgi:transposase-like protein
MKRKTFPSKFKAKSRGMNAPKLAIGDGAMGFWAALDEVYGETRQQSCWMHYATFRIMPISTLVPAIQVTSDAAKLA